MAFGSSGMVETPSSATNGVCLLLYGSGSANQTFTLTDSSGNTILSYTPSKSYQVCICYSTDISTNSSYTYTMGSSSSSVTPTSSVYSNGSSSSGMGSMGGNPSAGTGRNAFK